MLSCGTCSSFLTRRYCVFHVLLLTGVDVPSPMKSTSSSSFSEMPSNAHSAHDGPFTDGAAASIAAASLHVNGSDHSSSSKSSTPTPTSELLSDDSRTPANKDSLNFKQPKQSNSSTLSSSQTSSDVQALLSLSQHVSSSRRKKAKVSTSQTEMKDAEMESKSPSSTSSHPPNPTSVPNVAESKSTSSSSQNNSFRISETLVSSFFFFFCKKQGEGLRVRIEIHFVKSVSKPPSIRMPKILSVAAVAVAAVASRLLWPLVHVSHYVLTSEWVAKRSEFKCARKMCGWWKLWDVERCCF